MNGGRLIDATRDRGFLTSVCLGALILSLLSAPALAQDGQGNEAPPTPSRRVVTAPPPGFENLEDQIDTLFDVSVQGRRIGSFRAVLSPEGLAFADPGSVAAALDGVIRTDAVLAMLSQPLALNEEYRCFPGQTVGCGLLPPGVTGAIVDPQRFAVELFFSAADAVIEQRPPLALGASSSTGPTLVQNVGLSFSTGDFFRDEVEYGGSLDTYASVGRTALVAQTLLSSGSGNRLNQAHAQRIWSDRIARGGLIEDFSTSLLTNYRMAGATYGRFISPFERDDQLSAAPLDVVLPRDADVEIRRNGVLLSVRRYAAGPQRLDTTALPDGAYPVQITARADGVVVVDEIRSFSKAGGLPPAGKTDFNVGVGFYVPDQRFGTVALEDEPFFPDIETDAPIISMRIARRVGPTTGAELNLLAIDGDTYGEASVRSIFSNIEGIASVAAGSDGSYGVAVTGNVVWNDVRFSLSGRSITSDGPVAGPPAALERAYRAFLRSEDSFQASAQFLLGGGSLSVSGSYSRVDGFEDRYNAGLRYSRPIEIARRRAYFNAYAQQTDQDTRVGFTISFGFGVGQATTGNASIGLESVDSDVGSVRRGLSPVASIGVSRRNEWRNLDLTSQAGVSTNADNDRAFATVTALSQAGAADITAQHIRTRTGDFSTLYGNVQSGFVVGGGATKFGVARLGEAAILAEVETPEGETSTTEPGSGYRVRIDSQPTDLLRPGSRAAIGVPPYAEYEITLTPENAPPFDADLSIKRVTVYPGNVVRLQFQAQREFTLFGQVVDSDGVPLQGLILRSGNDLTTTDDFGYFTLTARADSIIEFRPMEGLACESTPVADLIDPADTRPFHRVGRLTCSRPAP